MGRMKNEPAEPTSNSENEHQNVSTSVPPAMLPENQPSATHSKSHAAHLEDDSGEPHTKPAGDLRAGSNPGARRQPKGGHGR
jgi:hypothetical protein